MHALFRALLVGLLLSLAGAALAADAQPGKALPDKPANVAERRANVAVVHEGTDSIGARLSTRLKETFNASNLFRLSEKDGPKMWLLLNTAPEFPERPGMGSVYSLTWAFSQNENHLSYLLSREVGTLSPDQIDALVHRIVERSDGIAVKYGYLFK